MLQLADFTKTRLPESLFVNWVFLFLYAVYAFGIATLVICCVTSIILALNSYGKNYCASTNIPLYVFIPTIVAICNVCGAELNIYVINQQYNYPEYIKTIVTKVNISLPFEQVIVNLVFFAWGYYEYVKNSCSDKLSHLLLYKLGYVIFCFSAILVFFNLILIAIWKKSESIFVLRTESTELKRQNLEQNVI